MFFLVVLRNNTEFDRIFYEKNTETLTKSQIISVDTLILLKIETIDKARSFNCEVTKSCLRGKCSIYPGVNEHRSPVRLGDFQTPTFRSKKLTKIKIIEAMEIIDVITPFTTIIQGSDYDFAFMSDGNDTLYYDQVPFSQQTQLDRSPGTDVIILGGGNDLAKNIEPDSRIYFGNAGNDTIWGGSGGDTLSGGRDTDSISGSSGDDLIFGNLGEDELLGGRGNDTILGGQDSDVIDGGVGSDLLLGDLGNDRLVANENDTLLGGAGADIFEISDSSLSAALVSDFEVGQDRIDLGSVPVDDITVGLAVLGFIGEPDIPVIQIERISTEQSLAFVVRYDAAINVETVSQSLDFSSDNGGGGTGQSQVNLGTLGSNAPISRSGTVSPTKPEFEDIYTFSLSQTQQVSLSANGFTQDVDLELYQDTNNNGRLDVGTDTYLNFSNNGGTSGESISQSLNSGNYLARVFLYQGQDSESPYTLTLSATGSSGGGSSGNYSSEEFEQRVLDLVNQERGNVGLQPLSFESRLAQAAETHSQNMALQDFYSHTGADGSDFTDRMEAAGFQFQGRSAENIAAGQTTPEAVMEGWMNSTQGHREAILNPEFTQLGVGHYFLENDTGNVNHNHYWTQVFSA
ncbi:CAP domain-containing protein [Baaleninema sp.]|uniref:CAP domain-containing protein n=1 Tax=Baaleninema sp. TaxID=3101197 RepID=UPI003D092854